MAQTTSKNNFANNRKDIQQLVTDTIIKQLEAGTIPWQKPWTGTEQSLPQLPLNFTTGNRYRGINILLLWSASMGNNFQSAEWASFKQWQSKGEMVRKGEKGNLIVYYDTIEKDVDGEIEKIPFLKTSFVFNRCQLASYQPPEPSEAPPQATIEKIAVVEAFVKQTQAIVEYHNEGACYHRVLDKILMPHQEYFIDTPSLTATEGFYSTLLHELVHWSGDKKRLDRTKGKKFGDDNYATEELVAEFAAAFLCAGFGIRTLEKGNHGAYIDHWLKVLKENKQILFSAASEASKAVDYLSSFDI